MKIVLIEDDKLLSEQLEALINGTNEMEVVGSYRTAEDAIEQINEASADVYIVDIGLPGISGLDFITRTSEKLNGAQILVHTVYEDRQNVFAALKAGAVGYITKGMDNEEIIRGLEVIRNGGSPMSPGIARSLIEEFQGMAVDTDLILTAREKEILSFIERGYSYMETADELHISHHTVHSHLKKTYEKLQAKNRLEALKKARQMGVI